MCRCAMCRWASFFSEDEISEIESYQLSEEEFELEKRKGFDRLVLLLEPFVPRLIDQLVRHGIFAYGPVRFYCFISV